MSSDSWYPVNIRESRYSGAYSGGAFIITCGARRPAKLDAFGGDNQCNVFWLEHKDKGPVRTVETALGEREVYVKSGDDPGELYDEFVEWDKENENAP